MTLRAGGPEGVQSSGSDDPAPDATVTPPSVLVADGPATASRVERWLQDLVPVAVANTRSETAQLIDRDVSVLVLGAGVSADAKETLLRLLSLRSPFARSVIVPADDQPPMLEDVSYDRCCYRPLERETVVEAVRRLARVAQYERTLAQYFEYTTTAAGLEASNEGDPAADGVDLSAIHATIDRLKARLQRMRASMDQSDLELVVESTAVDALPSSGDEEVERTTAKRQPDRCSECDLEWGVEHGGTLGTGCEKLGAFVWKCTRCGTVQEAPDPSHRRVA